MTEFTPLASLVGGALIGLSAVLLMAYEGRIAGISGISGRLLPPYRDGAFLSRLGFVAGLIVGFGSIWGFGCTSGHGVCGLSRLSPRSFVATGVFMAVAFATVFVTRHVIGG